MNMNSFQDVFNTLDWHTITQRIQDTSKTDVLRTLEKKGRKDIQDFANLISPAASSFLEEMAQESHRITVKRFGRTIQMYVPLYLSNECQNICTYCGFSYNNRIPRKTLTEQELDAEVEVIKGMGYDHVLLVTGEANQIVGVPYLKKAIQQIKSQFANISIEVQPLEEDEYRELVDLGLHAVLVYQETYNEENYKKHHPKGKKSNFFYRLETPERLGRAGVHKMGLGVLIGLEDWRTDSFFCASHLDYLEKHFWKTRYSISFPRLRPYSGGAELKSVMTDKELVQLICAYRIFKEELELSISTRESELFRNNIVKLGINSFSAGSKTDPGGYAAKDEALEQFEISDDRSPAEVSEMIESIGYKTVWKDWDEALHQV